MTYFRVVCHENVALFARGGNFVVSEENCFVGGGRLSV